MPFGAILGGVVTKVVDSVSGLISEYVEDKDKAAQLTAALRLQIMELMRTELQTARDIIVAEAQGGSWLQRSWRPITMLVFVALIVAKWLGFTAPGVTADLELALLDIIKVGLGGYVLGRSGEKIIREWKRNP